MSFRIQTPAKALLLRALCILSGIFFGVHICSCDVTWRKYDRTYNTRLTVIYDQIQQDTDSACCSKCDSYSMCTSVNYNAGSKDCQFSNINLTDVDSHIENSDEWVTFVKNESLPQQEAASTTTPSTAPNVCSEPIAVEFAIFDPLIEHAPEGQSVIYRCISGYLTTSSISKMTSTCQSNGEWTALYFQCNKECVAPPTAAHGSIVQLTSAYTDGASVNYQCDPDYHSSHPGLQNMRSTCQPTGQWTALLFECLPD